MRKLKKYLEDTRKKISDGGGDDNDVSVHLKKKKVDLKTCKAKKRFDAAEREKKDRKQKAAKEARLDSIAGGGGFSDSILTDVSTRLFYYFLLQ